MDIQTEHTNAYTQNRNNYPLNIIDAKRMINNYVPKFVQKDNSKKKGKGSQQQLNNDDEHQTEEEELLFLQQQDENWQYMVSVRRSIQQKSMIVSGLKTWVSLKQSQTQFPTRPNKKNRSMGSKLMVQIKQDQTWTSS